MDAQRWKVGKWLAVAALVVVAGCATSDPEEAVDNDDDPVEEAGSLEITVEGLADGLDADISVEGAEGFSEFVSATTVFDDIAVGEYLVEAGNVGDEGEQYAPQPSSASVELEAGEKEQVVIEYQLVDDSVEGTLPVEIEGLDTTDPAQVELVGEQDSQTIAAADSYVLEAGTYEVAVGDVSDGGRVFSDAGTVSEVEVVEGDNDPLVVHYELIPAALSVVIDGDLGDHDADVEVTGPQGFQESVGSEGASFAGLEPGEYSVSAEDIEDDAGTYVASGSRSLTLDSGDDETVTIVYGFDLEIADIEVNVTEFGDVDYEISLEGPEGVVDSFSGNTSFQVEVGTYLLSVEQVPEDGLGNEGYVTIEPDIFELDDGDVQSVDVEVGPGHMVTHEADDGPGSLRQVLSSVVDETTVEFASEVEEVELSSGVIDIDRSILIDGADSEVVINGGGGGILSVGSAESVEIDGVTLRGGDAARGGALEIGVGADVRASNMIFEDNEASEDGGAVFLDSAAELVLHSSTLRENISGDSGGAIFVDTNAELHVIDSVFEDNLAAEHGGAIATDRTLELNIDIDIERSLFTGNLAASAGGAVDVSGLGRVAESTFVENEAGTQGGALRFWDGELVVVGATIVDNEADEGGGIEYWGDEFTHLEVGRSIVADNTATTSGPDIASMFEDVPLVSLGYNVIGVAAVGIEDGVSGDQAGSDSQPLDPQLGALEDLGGATMTMAPTSESPALAAVPADECLQMQEDAIPLGDQRGEYRPAGGYCNAGAYEEESTLETFDDADMSRSQYQDGSFDGVQGIQWHYEDLRRMTAEDDKYYIGETNLLLHGDRSSRVWAEGVSGGIESMSVLISQGFTSSRSRTIDLYIDGEYVATSEDVTIDSDEEDKPFPVFVFAVGDLDIGGDFDIEFVASGDNQVVVDYLSWR